jgi:hypothetical protein
MLDLVRQTLASQFGAALKMVEDAIDKCQAENWSVSVGQFPFWHVAYHILFYVDLYLSPSQSEFRPQPFHRENYQFLGRQPFPPFGQLVADQPYDKPSMLAYVSTCRSKVIEILVKETESSLAGPSGFDWIPFSRAELHLYNIRHAQHHIGALGAFLGRVQGKGAAWVGMDPLLPQ